LDKRLVGEPLSGCSVNEAVEPRERVVLHIAFVQAKGELVNIAVQMLWAGMVIGTMQTA
jgi:hypothetical protein